jgi:hypothetical protein
MEAAMTNAAHYIGKAEEFERLAKEARDQTLKQHYKLLAEEYRGLAKYYSRRKADGGEPTTPSTLQEDRGTSGSH